MSITETRFRISIILTVYNDENLLVCKLGNRKRKLLLCFQRKKEKEKKKVEKWETKWKT